MTGSWKYGGHLKETAVPARRSYLDGGSANALTQKNPTRKSVAATR